MRCSCRQLSRKDGSWDTAVMMLTIRNRCIAQVLIVARSKLVLDFSLTIHGIHFLVVSLYEHQLPTSWLWWGLQALSAGLMISVATWACQWRELRPMTFGLRGIGEGDAGRSGGEKYEMVNQRDDEESRGRQAERAG